MSTGRAGSCRPAGDGCVVLAGFAVQAVVCPGQGRAVGVGDLGGAARHGYGGDRRDAAGGRRRHGGQRGVLVKLGGAALAHPRFVLHFTPTYASWIGQVERWFAELQRRCLERGVFCSLEELATALQEWSKLWNENVRSFTWTRTPDQIIDASAATAHASPDRDTRASRPGGR